MTTQQIQVLIESLTDNEDYQQELWVAYLSGEHLSDSLSKIHQKHQNIEKFQFRLHAFLNQSTLPSMGQILDLFTYYEKSILYLLILGYNIEEISSLYSVGSAQVEQAIFIISQHPGLKELLKSV